MPTLTDKLLKVESKNLSTQNQVPRYSKSPTTWAHLVLKTSEMFQNINIYTPDMLESLPAPHTPSLLPGECGRRNGAFLEPPSLLSPTTAARWPPSPAPAPGSAAFRHCPGTVPALPGWASRLAPEVRGSGPAAAVDFARQANRSVSNRAGAAALLLSLNCLRAGARKGGMCFMGPLRLQEL